MESQAINSERQSIRRRISNVFEMHSETANPLGRVMNLSQEGFMLLTKQAVDLNARHDLVLQLPQAINFHSSIELIGECRWCQPSNKEGYYGAGFAVVSVPSTKLETWKQFVAEF